MKQDWVNNDTGVVWRMNQPFWIASGGYNAGNTQLTLYVSPGRLRFPYRTKTVYSGSPQAFAVSNPTAARYYNIFMRVGGTFEISGSTTATIPEPIHADSEYLGQVNTGASLGVATLYGPWNQGTVHNPYEQRGELPAVTPAQPRIYYNDNRGIIKGALTASNHVGFSTASGIGWISLSEATGAGYRETRSVFGAMVQWTPSGALENPGYMLPSGILKIAPSFGIKETQSASNQVISHETYSFLQPQNPDAGNPHQQTSIIKGVSTGAYGVFGGFELIAYFNMANTSVSGGIRIVNVEFYVLPSFVPSSATDKRGEPGEFFK